MGSKISSGSNQKFQFIDGRDVQQSRFNPTNHQTSLQTKKQFYSQSSEGPKNGEVGQFTGLQQFVVPQKYTNFIKENPLKCEPPTIKGISGIDPYMFKKSLNVYYGQWKKGKPHGYGRIFNPDQDFYYQGYFQEGLPSYYGVFLAQNIQYLGQFKYGTASGQGRYIDGLRTISGEFKENYPSRNCVQKAENYTFTGNYEKGVWSQGKLAWNDDKQFYEGDFIDGLMHGYGILKTLEYFYQGDFKKGKKQGKGNIVWKTGDHYKGQFCEDQLTGKGQLYKENKLIFRGQFISGLPNGDGWIADNQKLIQSSWKNGHFTLLL